MARDWSQEEVEATVADHFEMLRTELAGIPFNKAEHNRNLQSMLNGRSAGAIERKHQNISAILLGLRHPFIDGYKPLANYQQLLWSVVTEHLERDRILEALVRQTAERAVTAPDVADLAHLWDPAPPEPAGERRGGVKEPEVPYTVRPPVHVDYLALEARNQSLGKAGEELVLRLEADRLWREGAPHLADRIEHVAHTQGDGLGYDVLSFESNGKERLIEVKTTSFGKRTPFHVTRNELACSQAHDAQYHLYRVYSFREAPRLFTLQGPIPHHCHLDPTQYLARIA